MKKDYLELGKIVNTHGVRGELKLEPWCDSPAYVKQFRTLYLDSQGKRPVSVVSVRTHGTRALLCLEGIDSLEAAEPFKNKVLYVKREDAPLEPGRYFVEDLLGCRVRCADTGEDLGEVREVSNYGASDIWHILCPDGSEALIPNIPDVVRELHVEEGYVVIHRMKGLFENAD